MRSTYLVKVDNKNDHFYQSSSVLNIHQTNLCRINTEKKI